MRVLNLLYELQEIASSIKFTKEPDSTVWKFSSNGRYSVKPLYEIFSPVIWKIIAPTPPGFISFCG
jgi:hypothetical protein